MGAELLKMADSLAVVVESLRLLAGIQESENAGAGARQEEKIETGNGKNAGKAGKESTENAGAKEMFVAVEEIRAVLAQKSVRHAPVRCSPLRATADTKPSAPRVA